MGLVDAVFPLEEVETRAIEKVKALTELPRKALSLMKINRTQAIRAKYDALKDADVKDFIDCWFSPETQELLHAASQKF